LASARQRPENQKENQAGHSPERAVGGSVKLSTEQRNFGGGRAEIPGFSWRSAKKKSDTRHLKPPGFCLQNAKIALNGAQSPRGLRKNRGFAHCAKSAQIVFSRLRAKINSFLGGAQLRKKRRNFFPGWLCGHALHRAPLSGRPGFSVLAGACQFGTAWAGLQLIHHHKVVDTRGGDLFFR